VTAQDVLHALRDLEFDEFLPAVEACLHGADPPFFCDRVRCCLTDLTQ